MIEASIIAIGPGTAEPVIKAATQFLQTLTSVLRPRFALNVPQLVHSA